MLRASGEGSIAQAPYSTVTPRSAGPKPTRPNPSLRHRESCHKSDVVESLGAEGGSEQGSEGAVVRSIVQASQSIATPRSAATRPSRPTPPPRCRRFHENLVVEVSPCSTRQPSRPTGAQHIPHESHAMRSRGFRCRPAPVPNGAPSALKNQRQKVEVGLPEP